MSRALRVVLVAVALAVVVVPTALAATPVNLVPPSVLDARTPNPWDGDVLDTDRGSWDANGDSVADDIDDPSYSFSYQWYRCTSNTYCTTTITGATSKSYTVTLTDRSRWLYVRVAARHDGGTAVSVNSARTGQVVARPPQNTSLPTVTGWPYVAKTLTSTVGAWTESHGLTITYLRQWQRSVDSQTWFNISAATTATYVPVSGDVGYRMRIRVNARSSLNNTGSYAYSDPTEPIAEAPPPPANTYAPLISGTVREGQPISTTNGAWSPSDVSYEFTYTWQRCPTGEASCLDIASGTAALYVPVAADVDAQLRARVVADNGGGTAEAYSLMTSPVKSGRPLLIAAGAVRGTLHPGGAATVVAAAWDSGVSYTSSLQWQRCDGDGQSCVDLPGETSGAHNIVVADVNHTLRVRDTATNPYGAETSTSPASPIVIDQAALEAMATAYRPALLFDQTEEYRPITITSFLAETLPSGQPAHQRCDTTNGPSGPYQWPCYGIDSPDDLFAPGPDGLLYSNLAFWSDSTGYHSPSCAPGAFFRDCGNQRAIYYGYGQNELGYRFIDYWFFYRYNEFAVGDHEGDWEGVTVQLNKEPGVRPRVAGYILAQHNKLRYRLAGGLFWCDDGALSYLQCLQTTPPVGEGHAAVFVASGSHASYEYACSAVLPTCPNPATGTDNEGSHSGGIGWEDNLNATCASDQCVTPLTRLDGQLAPQWPHWDGRWGSSGSLIGHELGLGDSPDSPGFQKRYTCTQVGWICSATVEGDPMPFALPQWSRSFPRARALASNQTKCTTWFDRGLAAFACSPSRLARSVRAGTLPNKGPFTLIVSGRRTATSPGLVQVIGMPLRAGTAVRLQGRPATDQFVILNASANRRHYLIRLTNLRMGANASARVVIRNGRPTVKLANLTARITVALASP